MTVRQLVPAAQGARLELWILDGGLDLAGWSGPEIDLAAQTEPELAYIEGVIRATLYGPAEVRVPAGLPVRIARVDGDAVCSNLSADLDIEDARAGVRVESTGAARIGRARHDVDARAIAGPLDVGDVGGHLAAQEIVRISAGAVGGTAIVSSCSGECTLGAIGEGLVVADIGGHFRAANVGGDAGVRGVGGDCELGAVGGDLTVEGVAGDLVISAGGDARVSEIGGSARITSGGSIRLKLSPLSGAAYDLAAGADAIVTLAANSSADVRLAAGGMIDVRLPTVREARGGGLRAFTLGAGGPHLAITAGGSISLAPADSREFEPPFEAHDGAAAALPAAVLPAAVRPAAVRPAAADGPAPEDERAIVLGLLEAGRIEAAEARALLEALGSL